MCVFGRAGVCVSQWRGGGGGGRGHARLIRTCSHSGPKKPSGQTHLDGDDGGTSMQQTWDLKVRVVLVVPQAGHPCPI